MTFINIDKIMITLCHYPLLEWPRSRYASSGTSYLVHGHLHNNRDSEGYIYIKEKLPQALNCGVDVNNYEPCTLEELVVNNERFYGR